MRHGRCEGHRGINSRTTPAFVLKTGQPSRFRTGRALLCIRECFVQASDKLKETKPPAQRQGASDCVPLREVPPANLHEHFSSPSRGNKKRGPSRGPWSVLNSALCSMRLFTFVTPQLHRGHDQAGRDCTESSDASSLATAGRCDSSLLK